ncbi:putative ABC transport system ATP-binding protein [Weissella uvarum]|uniref:ATP-binding cassette domain-containing protein n=1 Tax=Weissella uvarum TaxID=1479233 RepID=UPI001EF779BC|nr:ATP-binding cassette domain-containing protein [Weissella uvarum]MBM7617351.1 putative ABC transport system ATP-binding protein [Weissella uvarum]
MMILSSSNNVTLQSVDKKFGDKQVLKDVNLEFKKGQITTIFGRSGAGKTTLLNLIGLVDTPDSGKIKVFDQVLPKITSREAMLWRRNKLDYLFQNFGLIDDITVEKNLNISLTYKKLNKKVASLKKEQALADVGLDKSYLSKKIHTLSGGEQQRIAIAKTILKDPELVLADEPTGSLDIENKKKILNLLIELKARNKTLIIVSHDRDLENISDACVYL